MNFYDNTPFKFGFTSRSQIIEEMHPYLKKVIRDAKNRMIADIGCGCGRNLIYASRYSDSLIGIDLSKESLAFAESLGLSDNLELIYGDNLDIPLASNHIDLVISDGVIHHTGDTYLAFRECIRVLKPGGTLYLALYKKYRYYTLLYKSLGYMLRYLNKTRFGSFIMDNTFVLLHFLLYRVFRKRKLNIEETRNIFYDYFLTPIATFHSKNDVQNWIDENNCFLDAYDRTSGNCHVFIIKKDE